MIETVQYLNKHDFCFENVGCCCTVIHQVEFLTETLLWTLQAKTFTERIKTHKN